MAESLEALLARYIFEAEDAFNSEDEINAKDTWLKIVYGMKSHKDFEPDYMVTTRKSPQKYHEELPKLCEQLKGYLAIKMNELEIERLRSQKLSLTQNTTQSQNQNQEQSQSINVSFSQVINWVRENPSLSQHETDEILRKIDELKSISESSEPKKGKWENMKPFLDWLGKKGVDLAVQLLPLILHTLNIN